MLDESIRLLTVLGDEVTVADILALVPGGGGGAFDYTGSGSPEGVVTATVGKNYNDHTNGAIYEKVSGSGNTGWVAVGGGVALNAAFAGVQFDSHGLALLSHGAGSTSFGDVLGYVGTGNALYWNATGTDGEQQLFILLGSAGQFEWLFAADGSTSLPGPLKASDASTVFIIESPGGALTGIYLTDEAAQAGTFNALAWLPGTADGQQSVAIQLGSTGQFSWGFTSDGFTVLPGHLTVTGDSQPTTIHGATGGILIDDASATAGIVLSESGDGNIILETSGAGVIRLTTASGGIVAHGQAGGVTIDDNSTTGISLTENNGGGTIEIALNGTGVGSLNLFTNGQEITVDCSSGSLQLGFATAHIGFFGASPAAQPGAVTPPSGGATVDSQARTAIDAIITALHDLGLTA